MKKEDIKELIIKHSQKVETWINPDGEGYSTDDRWMDSDDINSMTEAIFRLFVVSGSVCPCNELPDGEIAISSKALQKPYGDLGQTDR